jgi:hypothetical protein
MLARIRSFVAALTITALVIGSAAPSLASSFDLDDANDDGVPGQVPVVLDVLVLRPLGLAMTGAGLLIYAFPVLPITAITRPTQIFKPLGPLVAAPARYTFSDPLGQH